MAAHLILVLSLVPPLANDRRDNVIRIWKQPAPRFGFLGTGRKEFLAIWCLQTESGPTVCVPYKAYTSANADPRESELRRIDLNSGRILSRVKLDYPLFEVPEKYRSDPTDKTLAMNFEVDGSGIEFATRGPVGCFARGLCKANQWGCIPVLQVAGNERPGNFDGRYLFACVSAPSGTQTAVSVEYDAVDGGRRALPTVSDALYIAGNHTVPIAVTRHGTYAFNRAGKQLWHDPALKTFSPMFPLGAGDASAFVVATHGGFQVRELSTNKILAERPLAKVARTGLRACGDLLVSGCLNESDSTIPARGLRTFVFRGGTEIWVGDGFQGYPAIIRAGERPVIAGGERVIDIQSGETGKIKGEPILLVGSVLLCRTVDSDLLAYRLPNRWGFDAAQ